MRLFGRIALALVFAASIAACSAPASSTPSASESPHVSVVTTTTVLADLVHEIAGDRASVTSLVPKGGDVHTFDPRPSSLRAVAGASLIVRNGLGLDDWVAGMVTNTGTKAPVVAAGEDLPGVTYLRSASGTVNPHVWMNVANTTKMVAKIADALAAADPAGAQAYADGAKAYQANLGALDAEIHARMATIPAANRTVVSFHDAFPYFADAYGLTIDGTIIAAPGQDPSAGSMADLVQAIRRDHVKAVFAEAQFNDELARTIAAETGAEVVNGLYDDTLGDAPLDSYLAIMRSNVDRVVGALGGG
ncbi:MAG TPA: metal ABC transporter substrate-binding protein [Candidatus Limnocylindrales bacterium]